MSVLFKEFLVFFLKEFKVFTRVVSFWRISVVGVNIQAHARIHTNTHTHTDKSVNVQFIHLNFFAVHCFFFVPVF